MLLPLQTPIGSNFLKDFPAVHSVNNGLIDAYTGTPLTTHGLGTYTPQLKASTNNPTIGTGGIAVLRGFYYAIFDQVWTWGEFRFGTTGASGGTGLYSITLPFTVLSVVGISPGLSIGAQPVVGTGSVWSNATPANRQPVTTHLKSLTEIQFSVKMNSGAPSREVASNSPFGWSPSDGMVWNARYQRVSS